MKTLNEFYDVEGNTLISNNYTFFDTDILEIRIQTLYGERTLRPFTDAKLKVMAQNVVDMYKPYLQELFTLPENYSILSPETKEMIRELSYKKLNDDTRDVTGNTSNTSRTESSSAGTEKIDETTAGTDNRTIDSTETMTYGKGTETDSNITTGEKGEDSTLDTTTHTGTAETASAGTTGDTLTKSISAYNQTDPTYTPREQDVTSGENSGTSTLTNDLEDKTNHSGNYEKNGSNIGNTHVQESGTDGKKIDTTDNLASSGSKNTDVTSNNSGSTDSNESGTSTNKDVFSGSELYDLNEKVTENGHLSYDEIINTIEKLFNPYDWLGGKIVNTICTGVYHERIK